MYRNPRTARLTPEYLQDAYVTRGLTGIAIGRELGVSQAEVYRALTEAGIPRRGRGTHAVGSPAYKNGDPHDPDAVRRAAKLRMRRLRAARGAQPRPGPPRDTIAPTDKWCPRCALVQPRTAFRRLRGAHPRIYSWCLACERVYQRTAYLRRKQRKEIADGSGRSLCTRSAD